MSIRCPICMVPPQTCSSRISGLLLAAGLTLSSSCKNNVCFCLSCCNHPVAYTIQMSTSENTKSIRTYVTMRILFWVSRLWQSKMFSLCLAHIKFSACSNRQHTCHDVVGDSCGSDKVSQKTAPVYVRAVRSATGHATNSQ